MLFDTTDARHVFRRVARRQRQAMQARARHAHQIGALRRTQARPIPAPSPDLLHAMEALAWCGLGPTAFYRWRNLLGIAPAVKRSHCALYARQDVVRIRIAALRLRQRPI